MPKHTPEQYARRDRLILKLAVQDRILLPPCAARLLADGKTVAHALKSLAAQSLLVGMPRSLPGGFSYYLPSVQCCVRAGASKDRATPLTGAALDAAIAMQFFTAMGMHVRHRLSINEVNNLVSSSLPTNVAFVGSEELGQATIFRVTLAQNKTPQEVVRQLRHLISQTERHGQLSEWLASRQLGFAVLCVNETHCAAVSRAVEKSNLSKNAPLIIDLGPDAEHYGACLKKRGGAA